MEWQRHRYSSFPWNEEAHKRRKKLQRQATAFALLMNLLFYLLGAFTAVVVLTYYPLPWG